MLPNRLKKSSLFLYKLYKTGPNELLLLVIQSRVMRSSRFSFMNFRTFFSNSL